MSMDRDFRCLNLLLASPAAVVLSVWIGDGVVFLGGTILFGGWGIKEICANFLLFLGVFEPAMRIRSSFGLFLDPFGRPLGLFCLSVRPAFSGSSLFSNSPSTLFLLNFILIPPIGSVDSLAY